MKMEPAILVIFGITGDLAGRYLLPALYHLTKDGLLHTDSVIIGVTRGSTTIDELFEKVEICVNEVDKVCDPATISELRQRTSMLQMDLDNPTSYDDLLERMNAMEQDKGVCLNRIYYLSIPPKAYRPVVKLLGQQGLNTSCQHGKAATRLMVEKPFGSDLTSASELINETAKHFSEDQTFRIDHYMAKPMVRAIVPLRQQNTDLEALINSESVSDIEIIAKEEIGIEGRAAFYEPLGALRDFIQNHLIQIASLLLLDPQTASQSLHGAKLEALKNIETVAAKEVAVRAKRGQYRGYRDEVRNPHSITETYAEVTLYSRHPRWQGVPIKLITGKALDERLTQVKINFKTGLEQAVIKIQPDPAIILEPALDINTAALADILDPKRSDAYERVIIDAIEGDRTWFVSDQEVIESWRIIQPVIEAWSSEAGDLSIYEPGTQPS
jgi:glucose-6-phosphate 1-dehydrogenase